MDLKKIGFSEQFFQAVSPKRKLISGFGLGAGASLLVLTAIFLYCPFKVSIFTTPKFQGFTSIGTNSSIRSWSFPFSSTPHSSSSSALQRGEEERVDGKTIDGSKNGNFSGFNGGEVVKQKTHDGNFTERSQNASISIGFNGGVKPLNGNATLMEKNATFSSPRPVGEETHHGILSGEAKNASVLGKTTEAITDPKSVGRGKSEGFSKPQVLNATSSDDGKNLRSTGNEGKDSEKIREAHGGNSTSEKIQGSNGGNGTEKIEEIHGGSVSEIGRTTSSVNDSATANGLGDHYGKCNIFDGRWVRDEEKPLYPGSSCTFIDRDFDCHLNGRPDEDFVKWRWQPNGCNIPRLNSTDFLERLRGKRLIFVGDSLNRNMWESLVCILRQSVEDKRRVHEISGRSHFKERISGFYSIRFDDYNCSVDFVSAPFLVKESSFNSANGSIPTLRLDTIDSTKAAYRKADVIVFNTGHWWTHEKTSKGENYYREGNYVYPKLNVLDAYKKALTTWGRWVDKNIDPNKTLVFFRGYSVTHFRGGQWNSGGQCHKETEPIFNETFLAKYPSKMRVVEKVIHQMKTPVVYLNISRLTDFRKDAHPSIYRMEYNTEEERIAAVTSQDCSHWCLPGVPDTWNELLYASLLKVGTGSWKT